MADVPILDAVPASNIERCASCRFYCETSTRSAGVPRSSGICRFNPPIWPFVADEDWCGRYETIRG